MTDYILAIDQGTTSSRAILFNKQGQPCFTAQQEFTQYFPQNGWVEHDAEEIWQTVLYCCQAVTEQLTPDDHVLGIGITNQRETSLIWHRDSGEVLEHAIVWQDRRTADFCEDLKRAGKETLIQEKTGLLLDPYFSASKLHWLLQHREGARALAAEGKLCFGTIDSFLIWRLTGGRSHCTDASNASRTMLFNIHSQSWDEEILKLFDIPATILPTVMDCAAHFGDTDKRIFGRNMPILGVAGDQQAALIGQACFHPGMAKSTYGTGCFMILNTGDNALRSQNRLLTTVAYRLNGKVCYALEGSIFIAGAAIQWLRDGLHLISNAHESEPLAEQTQRDHGVYLVPAFTGLGAPYWDPEARGAIFGLTRDTGIKEIVTAGLQSVCYQSKDLQRAMEKDGRRPTALRVDGGMAANNWVMQFLADILGAEIDRPSCIETTATGVAYLAGLQAGVFDSLRSLEELWQSERRFAPEMSKQERDKFYAGWQQAIASTMGKGEKG